MTSVRYHLKPKLVVGKGAIRPFLSRFLCKTLFSYSMVNPWCKIAIHFNYFLWLYALNYQMRFVYFTDVLPFFSTSHVVLLPQKSPPIFGNLMFLKPYPFWCCVYPKKVYGFASKLPFPCAVIFQSTYNA